MQKGIKRKGGGGGGGGVGEMRKLKTLSYLTQTETQIESTIFRVQTT
jgi:hypothetical protein